MAENGPNGNGWKSALAIVATLAGLVTGVYIILDQKIDGSRAERAVLLDAMRGDLTDHARRMGLMEQHAAAMNETVREIETQFKWANEVRGLEDAHLREMMTHDRK